MAQLADTVLAENLRMQQLVSDLLLLAAADEQPPAPAHDAVDLDDLVFARPPTAGGSGLRVDTTAVSAGRVIGDAMRCAAC